MATQNQTQAPRGEWGLRRYHVGFALAFGVGAALLPPDGTLTIAGWFGGALGSVVAGLLVAGVVVGALRVAEDWRPTHVADPEIPQSRTRHAVYAAIVIQLFAFGLGTTAGLSTEGMLFFAGPVNVLVGAAVAIDVAALRKRGLGWDTVAYGYAVAGLVLGFVGGLAYWRARGRKRAEHAQRAGGQAGQGQPPQGGQGQPPAGGPQQGAQPPQGGQTRGGQPRQQGGQGQPRQQGRQPPQGGQGQPPQGGQGQPPQGGQGQPRQGGRGQSRQGGRNRGGQGRRSQQGSRGAQPRGERGESPAGGPGSNQPTDDETGAASASDDDGDAADVEDAATDADSEATDADSEPDADDGPEPDDGSGGQR